MAVSNTTVKEVYPGGQGDKRTYAIPFDYDTDDTSVIEVYIRDESSTPTNGVYTETLQTEGAGNDYQISGSNVVFNSDTAATEKIVIIRDVTDDQEFDPVTTAQLDSDALEAELDEIVRMIQENSEKLSRAALFLPGSGKSGFNLPQPVANEFLKWNSAADGLENSGAITDQDLFTTDSPTFADVTITNLTGSRVVKTDGSSNLTTGTVDLTSSNEVTGALPLANGGTGQTTQTAAFDALAPTTTAGDIIAHNGTDNIRIPVGNNGEILSANSAVTGGVEWVTSASSTLTTKGDIFTYDSSNARLPVGTNGQVLIADSSETTGLKWEDATSLGSDPLTTKGDLFTYDTDAQRLAVGTDGQVLIADSTEATGLKWEDATALGSDPLTTKGDLFTFDSDAQRLAVGADGRVLKALASEATGLEWGQVDISSEVTGTLPIGSGGTGQTTQTAAMDALSPSTTKGDILVDDGTNVIRVGVGSNDQVLTADSSEASGVKWAAAAGGGGGGTSVVLHNDSGTAPLEQTVNDLKVWTFSDGGSEELFAGIKVPEGFTAANQITLYVYTYSQTGTTNTQLISAVTTLIADDGDITSTTNQHSSTNTAQTPGGSNQITKHTIDLTDGSGEINSVAVAAGDFLKVNISRGTDSDTTDLLLLPDVEVTFS